MTSRSAAAGASQASRARIWGPGLRAAVWGLGLGPFVWLAALVWRYGVDVPYYDQWGFVPLLDLSLRGQLSLADVWATDAEHRQLFPKLALVGLARLTSWNIRWEMAVNVALAVGIFGVLAHMQWRAARQAGVRGVMWWLPMVSVIVFGLAQMENWLWGWQMSYFICVLAVVAGLSLVTSPQLTWWRLAAGAGAGVVATYSFACGLPYWPVGLLAVAAAPTESRRTRGLRVMVWVIISALVAALYFHGYRTPSQHPGPRAGLAHPLDLARFALLYLGFPVGSHHPLRVGVLGVLILVGAVAVLVRGGKVGLWTVMPFVCLALYAMATGLTIGVGRVGFGLIYALRSRYITYANLMWVAMVGLLYLIVMTRASRPKAARGRAWVAAAAAVAAAGIAVGAFRASWEAAPGYAVLYEERSEARAALLEGRDSPALDELFLSKEVVKERAQVLRRRGLSLFRGEAGRGRGSAG